MVPTEAIAIVNNFLGIEGEPYYVVYENVPELTNCVVWKERWKEDEELEAVRELVATCPVWIYTSNMGLVMAPTTNQFDVLRIEGISGSNDNLTTEEIIKGLEALDKNFGLTIYAASFDRVDFQLKRLPTLQEIRELRRWLPTFCSSYEAGTPTYQIPTGKFSLWWD